jgi:hypothetical protein
MGGQGPRPPDGSRQERALQLGVETLARMAFLAPTDRVQVGLTRLTASGLCLGIPRPDFRLESGLYSMVSITPWCIVNTQAEQAPRLKSVAHALAEEAVHPLALPTELPWPRCFRV